MNVDDPQGHPEQDEVGQYLDAVRAELTDLSPDVRDELLEDLPAHLAEVRAEDAGPLVERLGAPAEYAAELRAAAGIEPAEPGRSTTRRYPRLAAYAGRGRVGLRSADREVGRMLGYPRATDFLVLLIPGWWVLRAYLVTMIVLGVFFGWTGILPMAWGSRLVGLFLFAVAVIVSVRLGSIRRRMPTAPKVVVRGFTALVAVLSILTVAQLNDNAGAEPYYGPSSPWDGIDDLYPYDSGGRPLTGVQLFDENGNPLQIGDPYRCRDYGSQQQQQFRYPLCAWPGSPAPSSPTPSNPVPSNPVPSSPASSGTVPQGPISQGPAPSSGPTPSSGSTPSS